MFLCFRVLILAEGSVGFMGSAENALQFFDGIGFTCPANYNPADFFIQTLAIVPGQEMERKARVQVRKYCVLCLSVF